MTDANAAAEALFGAQHWPVRAWLWLTATQDNMLLLFVAEGHDQEILKLLTEALALQGEWAAPLNPAWLRGVPYYRLLIQQTPEANQILALRLVSNYVRNFHRVSKWFKPPGGSPEFVQG
jgi:hypothetical protein